MKKWKYLLLSLLSLLTATLLILSFSDKPESSIAISGEDKAEGLKTSIVIQEKNKERDSSLLITAVGDIMVHESQWISQKTSEDVFDFKNNFVHVSPFLQASDLSFANFESTIHQGRPFSSFPVFNSPPEILDAMKEAGITHVSTANNHSMDTGYEGILGTLRAAEDHGLIPLGTYESKVKKGFHIETVKGMKLGIASYATGYFSGDIVTVNSIRSDGLEDHINFIHMTDPEEAFRRIREDLILMKEASVDAVILLLHWGTEYDATPSSYQKTLAKLLIEEGVHLIIGAHPHLLQEMELIKSSKGDHEGLVLYSLGNFLSNQREEILGIKGTEDGGIARILMEKDASGKVIIKEGTLLPTWVYRKDLSPLEKIYTYEIVPLLGTAEETSAKYSTPLIPVKEVFRRVRKVYHSKQIFTP